MTQQFKKIAQEMGDLVTEKNAAYGDSFAVCGEFLRMLYPTGITVEQYTDALCLVRIFDKMKRIATRKDAFGESPYRDIMGYALLGVAKDERDVRVADTSMDPAHPVPPGTCSVCRTSCTKQGTDESHPECISYQPRVFA